MLLYLGVVSTIADVDSKLSIDCAEDTVPSVPLNANILHHPWLKNISKKYKKIYYITLLAKSRFVFITVS